MLRPPLLPLQCCEQAALERNDPSGSQPSRQQAAAHSMNESVMRLRLIYVYIYYILRLYFLGMSAYD